MPCASLRYHMTARSVCPSSSLGARLFADNSKITLMTLHSFGTVLLMIVLEEVLSG